MLLFRMRRYILKHSRVFDQISKHHKVRQKYFNTRLIFNSLLEMFGNLVTNGLSRLIYL